MSRLKRETSGDHYCPSLSVSSLFSMSAFQDLKYYCGHPCKIIHFYCLQLLIYLTALRCVHWRYIVIHIIAVFVSDCVLLGHCAFYIRFRFVFGQIFVICFSVNLSMKWLPLWNIKHPTEPRIPFLTVNRFNVLFWITSFTILFY